MAYQKYNCEIPVSDEAFHNDKIPCEDGMICVKV